MSDSWYLILFYTLQIRIVKEAEARLLAKGESRLRISRSTPLHRRLDDFEKWYTTNAAGILVVVRAGGRVGESRSNIIVERSAFSP